MTSMIYSPADVDLIIQGKTFDATFQILTRIWRAKSTTINDHYRHGEVLTNKLESTLHALLPPLYDELSLKCEKEKFIELTRKKASYCLIIMDSLSLREGILLTEDLKDSYETQLQYAFSTLPSDTDTFRQRAFGRTNITQYENDNLHFVRNCKDSTFTNSKTQIIWSDLPDKLLHISKAGHSELLTSSEIYEQTLQCVKALISASMHDEIIITSDHGYVDLTAGCTFSLGERSEAMLSNQFKNRWKRAQDNWELEQLLEQGIIRCVNDYCVVQGRYSWVRRGPVNTRLHGGLSLMECMVPVINIERRQDDV